MADGPGTVPHARVAPGGVCGTLHGEPLAESMRLGVRTWGNAPDGATTLLVGTYLLDGEIGRRLLDALPPLIIPPGRPLRPAAEAVRGRDRPGRTGSGRRPGPVLDRLLDLLLIAVLRTCFARPGAAAPRLVRGPGRPGRRPGAERHLQDEPSRPWTVASPAARTGVSRAGLAGS
ncbi:cupin domain-containing protein [Streptomyces sp. NBC_01102]|uniref:cupin domain-containing protein n=1 Tax=Streptomyces sp. NBC_01102 TaxID=2903749 RepID=UPI00386E2570|nr:cupin domain-containing protein [Streptomyces sp. NBC_01102]